MIKVYNIRSVCVVGFFTDVGNPEGCDKVDGTFWLQWLESLEYLVLVRCQCHMNLGTVIEGK